MAKKDVTKPISLDPRGGRPREKCVTHIDAKKSSYNESVNFFVRLCNFLPVRARKNFLV